MTTPQKPPSISLLLADPSQPVEQRIQIIRMVSSDINPETDVALKEILKALEAGKAADVLQLQSEKLAAMMRDMEEGPLRCAVVCSVSPASSTGSIHVQIILDDGSSCYTVVPDPELAAILRRGHQVLVEARGRAILRLAPNHLNIGEEACLERTFPDGTIEVSVRGQERHIFLTSEKLEARIQAGEVFPGATVLVNARQQFAFDAVPPADSLSHLRYLERVPVPNIVAARDMGNPPRIIDEITEMVRIEMTEPDVRRRFRLRRCVMQLLTGVPGSGKTMAIAAIWRRIYEVMSEVTQVPIDELPQRVFRLEMSRILNFYLGESDKNLELFFREVEHHAAQPFMAPNGKEYFLPVLAILEEIDGLARSRGQDGIHDRILTTALQRLDPARPELQDKLIIFLGTTNEAQQVDRAFLRRIGAKVHKFGRLDRSSFRAVLRKHLAGMPVIGLNGHGGASPEVKERALLEDLSTWLFSPNSSDPGVVEIMYAGSPHPDVRFRRDFLTGALVDRAVQQAAGEASLATYRGAAQSGLSRDRLMQAFDDQIRTIIDHLSEHNARHYLDLPDAMHVATVRRLPQPTLFPLQLQHP